MMIKRIKPEAQYFWILLSCRVNQKLTDPKLVRYIFELSQFDWRQDCGNFKIFISCYKPEACSEAVYRHNRKALE